jgi:hypothetical protein
MHRRRLGEARALHDRARARPRRRGGRSVVLDHRASLARRLELRFRCAFSTPARDARTTRSPHWTKPLQMRGIGIPLREDARRCRRSSFLRGLPASGGSERLFPARDERGMKRSRRSFCAEPATENADLQDFSGSDGTRTRDLRRDRPARLNRLQPATTRNHRLERAFPRFANGL